MEENLNQQKQSTSPPPAPEITIRTMGSDVESIKQGGGEIIAPQPFIPEIKTEEPEIKVELNIPGYTGPEKEIFVSAAAVSSGQSKDKKITKWKPVTIIIGILIICICLGLLGYFVIFPWLFPLEMPAVQ